MIYLIDPEFMGNQRCRSRDICGRLSIQPICPPNLICPLKK
jgi:hypothetical protein